MTQRPCCNCNKRCENPVIYGIFAYCSEKCYDECYYRFGNVEEHRDTNDNDKEE